MELSVSVALWYCCTLRRNGRYLSVLRCARPGMRLKVSELKVAGICVEELESRMGDDGDGGNFSGHSFRYRN